MSLRNSIITASLISFIGIVHSLGQQPQLLRRVDVPATPHGESLIALTFDDGPRPRFLESILDTLAEQGARATFCMQGNNMQSNPGWAAKAAQAGHQVESHSFSHPNFLQITSSDWDGQLRSTHQMILNETGRAPTFFRPPNLAYNDALIAFVDEEFGYRILHAAISTQDWGHTQTGMLLPTLANIKPGDIVLCHEVNTTALDLHLVLDWLRSQGLHSVTVDELEAFQTTGQLPFTGRPIKAEDRVLIDFGPVAAKSLHPDEDGLFWNNVVVANWEGPLHTAPYSTKGDRLNVAIQYGSRFDSVDANGVASAGPYPINAQRDFVRIGASTHEESLNRSGKILISGLDPNLAYTVRMFGSRSIADGAFGNLARYSIGNRHADLDLTNNTDQTATFENVAPGPSGVLELTVGVSPLGTARYAGLSIIDIEAHAPSDADSDGLPDHWEITYGLDSADAEGDNGADGDPDGDAQSNFDEFLLQTDPMNRDSFPATVQLAPSQDGLSISFPTVRGRTYTLQHCAALGTTWTDGESLNGSGETVQIPLSATEGFFRIKVATATIE